MKKQSFLDKIDDELSVKTKSQVQTIALGLMLVIAFVVYMLVFPPAQDFFDEKLNKLNEVRAEIAKIDIYFRTSNDAEIRRSQDKLQQKINHLEELEYKNDYINKKLIESPQTSYSEENWVNFLDTLTSNAKENNVKIFSIANKHSELNATGVHPVFDVNVSLEGSFHSVLKYINSIEESEMVVDVHGMDINATGDELIGGNIEVSVWGIVNR